jgi:hypothetical protein
MIYERAAEWEYLLLFLTRKIHPDLCIPILVAIARAPVILHGRYREEKSGCLFTIALAVARAIPIEAIPCKDLRSDTVGIALGLRDGEEVQKCYTIWDEWDDGTRRSFQEYVKELLTSRMWRISLPFLRRLRLGPKLQAIPAY